MNQKSEITPMTPDDPGFPTFVRAMALVHAFARTKLELRHAAPDQGVLRTQECADARRAVVAAVIALVRAAGGTTGGNVS